MKFMPDNYLRRNDGFRTQEVMGSIVREEGSWSVCAIWRNDRIDSIEVSSIDLEFNKIGPDAPCLLYSVLLLPDGSLKSHCADTSFVEAVYRNRDEIRASVDIVYKNLAAYEQQKKAITDISVKRMWLNKEGQLCALGFLTAKGIRKKFVCTSTWVAPQRTWITNNLLFSVQEESALDGEMAAYALATLWRLTYSVYRKHMRESMDETE